MINFNSKIVTYAALGMAVYFFYEVNISANKHVLKPEQYHKEVYDGESRYSYKIDPKKSKDEMNFLEKYFVNKYKDKNTSLIANYDHVDNLDLKAGVALKIGDKIYVSVTPENSVYTENPAEIYVLGEEVELKKYEKYFLEMKTGEYRFVNDENNLQIRLKVIGIFKEKEKKEDDKRID